MGARKWIAIVGGLYGAWGAGWALVLAFYILADISAIFTGQESQIDGFLLLYMGAILVNVIIGLTILYGFATYRRWGRYLAIVVSAALAALPIGIGLEALLRPSAGEAVGDDVGLIVLGLLPLSFVYLCLRRDVRELMNR